MADRQLVGKALLVTNRGLRKWINCFNQAGVDGLIVKKRPDKMTIINDQQAMELTDLIDQPQQARRNFWTAKASHDYIRKNEEKLLERLDQAILDVINNPKKTQKTACIGTLI